MVTINEIKDFMQQLGSSTFDTKRLIKGAEIFRRANKQHSLACDYVNHKISNNFRIKPLGESIPWYQETLVKVDVPDFAYYHGRGKYSVYDVKYKSKISNFGWINERAYKTYLTINKGLELNVYAIFTNLDKIGWCLIEEKLIEKRRSWDRNIVCIFEWFEGLPF